MKDFWVSFSDGPRSIVSIHECKDAWKLGKIPRCPDQKGGFDDFDDFWWLLMTLIPFWWVWCHFDESDAIFDDFDDFNDFCDFDDSGDWSSWNIQEWMNLSTFGKPYFSQLFCSEISFFGSQKMEKIEKNCWDLLRFTEITEIYWDLLRFFWDLLRYT